MIPADTNIPEPFSKEALSAGLGSLLRLRGMTIATAESCTGGGIGAAIASTDGASDYFVGGVISYATRIKEDILGVDATLIERFGVVSEQTALSMNKGVRALMNADAAISITGYAGASGGDEFASNGTVWICAATGKESKTKCLNLRGARTDNLSTAVMEALALAISLLEETGPEQ